MRGLLPFAVLFVAVFGKKTFEGHQVLRIVPKNDVQLHLIKDMEDMTEFELDFWREVRDVATPVDIRVPLHSLQSFKVFLETQDIEYSVTIEDLQMMLDEEQEEMESAARVAKPRNTDSYDYANYHSISDIYSFQDMLVAENPNLVSKVVIGQSFESRPLNVLKFSTGGTNRPAIWIDCGIHAREWITPASGTWFAKKIATDFGGDQALTAILNRMDIYLEIVTNPDGYQYTRDQDRLWRKTRKPNPGSPCVGVDPNRNWDAGFGGPGTSNNPCSQIYRGPRANSESEVKSIVDFVNSNVNFKAFITVHAFSQLLLYPYGFKRTPARDRRELDALARRATTDLTSLFGTRYRFGSIVTTIYQASGGSIDWAYDQGIKYSYAFELRDTGSSGFLLPANQIIPTAQETWLALMAIMDHTNRNSY
ncbi:Hypothetical predicted protein [Scomber scombrus]|uniref:Carboxypeptidase A1 n=1 Tax=Scomber scombrus TaxID=13677 RepID=A0AAV1N7L5_SCOSC